MIFNFDKLQEAYNETLIGKEFVYLSKYGSTTFGKVKSVNVISSSSMDVETGRKLKLALSKVSPKVNSTEKDLEPIQVERKWWGYKPQITILSENNVPYDLNEDNIYFIDGKNTETTE